MVADGSSAPLGTGGHVDSGRGRMLGVDPMIALRESQLGNIGYSYLSASIGSTFMARRAGI
jgi:hypothetical protein